MRRGTLFYGLDARLRLLRGTELVARCAALSLGPGGRNAVMEYEPGLPRVTKDGVTIVKNVGTARPAENLGVALLKSVAASANAHCGDGTTTTTLLTAVLFREGVRMLQAGAHPARLRRGVERGVAAAKEFLGETRVAAPPSREGLLASAMIATNADEQLAAVIADALTAAGLRGRVHLEPSPTGRTEVHVLEFGSVLRGYSHPGFLLREADTEVSLPRPRVLLVDGELTRAETLLPFLAQPDARPLAIFCRDMPEALLSQLAFRAKAAARRLCVVTLNMLGGAETELLEDLACLFGCRTLSPHWPSPDPHEFLGSAKLVRSSAVETQFWTAEDLSAPQRERIAARMAALEAQLADGTERQRLLIADRLTRLGGKAALICVGGQNKALQTETHDKLVDGLNAARAAAQDGVVPGGGAALLFCAEVVRALPTESVEELMGIRILEKALRAPFEYIVGNAGAEPKTIAERLLATGDPRRGYCVRRGQIVDMIEAGVVDSCRNLLYALDDCLSVGTYMLSCECVVTTNRVYVPPRMKEYPSDIF